MKITWLAAVLRDAGLKVVEEDGWRDRGTDWPAQPRGILAHHTASKAGSGNTPALETVRDGRPDLKGPLSQLVLGRDGTWHVVAAGRSNHAGTGVWAGITTGNSSFIGIEAENDGVGEPWPDQQLESYERGCAAILLYLKQPPTMVAGHKEYALPVGRKIDPTFDMVHFRADVAAWMHGLEPTPVMPPSVDPTLAMLQKGMKGQSVLELQLALNNHGAKLKLDKDFGAKTEAAVKAFQKKNDLKVDGLVGPKTWKKLLLLK